MSCKILHDMTLVIGVKVPWTTARLVQETLDLGLHVVENPPMIKFLRRTKFVDLVVRGTVGWQEGVRTLKFFYTFKLACYLALLVFNIVYDVLTSSTYATHLLTIILTICNS
jgi:hypothetical protein